MGRRWVLLCLLLLSLPFPVFARDLLADDICIIEASATITGSVFAFCEELIIEGTVRGDIFAAAVRTRIEGTVTGSVYIIGGQLDVTGRVTKDIHFGGAALQVNPPPAEDEEETSSAMTVRTGSIKALALSTILHSGTFVDGTITMAGYQLWIDGDVRNEINYWGSALMINGEVDSNVFAVVGDPTSDSAQIETLLLPFNFDLELVNPGLIVGESGIITGLLNYQGPVAGAIAGQLTLEPEYTMPQAPIVNLDEPGFFQSYAQELGSEFSTLVIIGMIVVFFVSSFLEAPVSNLRNRPFASLAVGMLGFLLSFPVVLIIVVLSLSLLGFLFILGFRGVVIAIALVLGLVNVGAASIFYFVAIFVTRAIVGLAIGRFILRIVFRRTDVDERRWLQYLALVMGVFLLSTLASFPVVGIIFNATALFLGLGAVMIVVSAQFERLRTVVTPTGDHWYTPSPAIIREHRLQPGMEQAAIPAPTPPLPDPQLEEKHTEQNPPGTDNLPDGFSWEFFED